MAKLKTYSMNLDGTHNVMVAASSQRAAAELIGTTVYMLRTWDAGYNEDDEALALSEPGQVFRQKGVNGAWERWPLTPVGFSEPQPPLVQIPGSASEQPETLFSKLVRFHRTKGYLRDGDEAAVEFHHHSARAIEEMRLALELVVKGKSIGVARKAARAVIAELDAQLAGIGSCNTDKS